MVFLYFLEYTVYSTSDLCELGEVRCDDSSEETNLCVTYIIFVVVYFAFCVNKVFIFRGSRHFGEITK